MTFKEMNLCVFRGEALPHVFFQPRFEPWFAWHEQFGSLPSELCGLSLREAYDLVGASMRTVHYYSGQPDPVECHVADEVKTSEEEDRGKLKRRYDTPYGPLFQTFQMTVDKVWRCVEFAAKKREDLPALRWLLAHRVFAFSPEKFESGARFLGDRGEPQFWVPKSPYLALAQQWMRCEDFVYALADYRDEIEDIMTVIDESYDRLYDELT